MAANPRSETKRTRRDYSSSQNLILEWFTYQLAGLVIVPALSVSFAGNWLRRRWLGQVRLT